MIKPISIEDYCLLAKVSKPAISYRITNNKVLPGIEKYEYNNEERRYDLFPSKNFTELDIASLFRSH